MNDILRRSLQAYKIYLENDIFSGKLLLIMVDEYEYE